MLVTSFDPSLLNDRRSKLNDRRYSFDILKQVSHNVWDLIAKRVFYLLILFKCIHVPETNSGKDLHVWAYFLPIVLLSFISRSLGATNATESPNSHRNSLKMTKNFN